MFRTTDFFVITRSDYIYTMPHPSTRVLSEDHLYIPDGEGYGGVTDRHVILPRKFVIPYLNMLEKMVLQGEDYCNKMKNHSDWNLERFIKFHLFQNSILNKVIYFPYVMYSIRPEGGTTRWASGNYSPALGYYIKYESEYQSAIKNLKSFKEGRLSIDNFYRRRFRK